MGDWWGEKRVGERRGRVAKVARLTGKCRGQVDGAGISAGLNTPCNNVLAVRGGYAHQPIPCHRSCEQLLETRAEPLSLHRQYAQILSQDWSRPH